MAKNEERVADTQEVNERDAEARKIREDAIAYADRVAAGEEPWKDEEADVDEDEEAAPDNPAVVAPRNDDVGETDSDAPEVIEVDQDNPAPEPTE